MKDEPITKPSDDAPLLERFRWVTRNQCDLWDGCACLTSVTNHEIEALILALGAPPPAAPSPKPETLTIVATDSEVEFLAVAAGLRAQSVEEYVKRAINAALRKQGVDAVLFKESDDE